MTQITDHHTSISNDFSAVLEEAKALYKDLFLLTPSFIDKEGNRIRLWSAPGPTVVATIQKTNGIFQYGCFKPKYTCSYGSCTNFRLKRT